MGALQEESTTSLLHSASTTGTSQAAYCPVGILSRKMLLEMAPKVLLLCVQQTKECQGVATHMKLGIAHPPVPVVINFRKQLFKGLQGAYPAAMATIMVVPAGGGGSCELHSCKHSCCGGSSAAGCRQVLMAADAA